MKSADPDLSIGGGFNPRFWFLAKLWRSEVRCTQWSQQCTQVHPSGYPTRRISKTIDHSVGGIMTLFSKGHDSNPLELCQIKKMSLYAPLKFWRKIKMSLIAPFEFWQKRCPWEVNFAKLKKWLLVAFFVAESREKTSKIVKLSLLQLDGFYNALCTRIQNWNNDKWYNFVMHFEENVIIRISQINTSERTGKCH